MTTIRRLAWLVFGVACTHLVFGAIVRISGSGMGCGPHWPKCYGAWFPPFDRPDLVIEVLHRYLASVLLLSLIVLVVAAFRRRHEPGVGGRGGVLRSATLAMSLGFCAAVLGAVTVKLANSAPATVAHWTVAMSLVAAVTATVIRAGGLGGTSARRGGVSNKARRGTLAGAAMALAAVVMGGLTAKVQGGPIACLAFPLCGANPLVPRGAVHVQSTHRIIAVLLVLHLAGLFFAFRKRQEAAVVRRAVSIALGLGVVQLLIAGAMIGMHLPPVLRSLHEATGVSIWIATFALAYLSRLASDEPGADGSAGDPLLIPIVPLELSMSAAAVRATVGTRPTFASAVVAGPVAEVTRRPIRAGSAERLTPVSGTALLEVPESVVLTPAFGPAAPVDELSAAPASHDATPPVTPAQRVTETSLELPVAQERGSRAAVDAALAYHRVAAAAVEGAGAEATADRAANDVVGMVVANVAIAGVGAPPSEHDSPVADETRHQAVASVIEDTRPTSGVACSAGDVAVRAAYLPLSPAGLTSLAEISARRRPSMSHSIAVIVARGADV